MNIYDTKTISCAECGKNIGEVESDAVIIQPRCGQCADPMHEDDKICYAITRLKEQQKIVMCNNARLPNVEYKRK